jgi:hypothetical protein
VTEDRISASEQDEDLAEKLQEFVYGTITALVVIGALDGEQLRSPRNATVVVVGTAIATWLAHTFAALIGVHVRERRAIRRYEIATKFRRSWRIVTAAVPTTVLLVLADIGWIALRSALSAATAVGILQLVVVGVIAARRSEFTLLGVAAYAAGATVIGLVIVAIEIAAFH